MKTMEKTKLTVLILDDKGSKLKQASFPKFFLPLTLVLLVGSALLIYLGLWDYHRLQKETNVVDDLRTRLVRNEERLAQQRNQIVNFTNDIEMLNEKLAELQDFEKRIRVIADIEPSANGKQIFGVGGSSPEDLDPVAFVEQEYQDLVRDMHIRIDSIDQATHDQRKAFTSLFDRLEEKRNLLAATPSIRPVKGWISSRFGYRSSPFTHRREFHRGLDIAAREGTPIVAPAEGTITFAGKKRLMGNMITIDHGFGMVTRYGHIRKLLKKKGDHVERGETIALVGNTGRSTGPHVHYEVHLNGVAVNPTKYFAN